MAVILTDHVETSRPKRPPSPDDYHTADGAAHAGILAYSG